MKTSDFDYFLPEEQIAQHCIEPRELAKMLILDRERHSFSDARVRDLVLQLHPGDLLVRNVTKVFNARLRAWFKVEEARERVGDGEFEVLITKFVHELADGDFALPRSVWEVLVRPGKKIHEGDELYFGYLDTPSFAGDVSGYVQKKNEDGTVLLQCNAEKQIIFDVCERYGAVPIPPYVHEMPFDNEYQTVYAKHIGAAAAPTAGFHLNDTMLALLETHGVQFADVVLHVGVGTFRPIKTESILEHDMHAEWVEITQETVDRIRAANIRGNRVIAVGTTTVRALEGVYDYYGELAAYEGDINIYITPGYEFHVVDGLLTNFHLPKSTLLVMISAFAKREFVLQAYDYAVKAGYRFYSFGDCMLIV